MKFYLGVTDYNWYRYLCMLAPDDVNFWRPGGKTPFRSLGPGAPFFFKLKSPYNAVGGVGFFSSFTKLSTSMAWNVFEKSNGCDSFHELRKMILQYREDSYDENPEIGCIILTNPIFFKQDDWLPIPDYWNKSIVQGKSFDSDTFLGKELWTKLEHLLQKYMGVATIEKQHQLNIESALGPQYGNSILTKVRLGQGAFRIQVTDAYGRKCAISGEKTLPALEAAHIKPYALSGPHMLSNSLLLRSDMHKLFDAGYITIAPDLRINISKRIKEEFENGHEYYKFHGKELFALPKQLRDRPAAEWLAWHNTEMYNG